MDKREFQTKFEKNVAYLRHNIPPDDIYEFAEQTFMAAQYFLFRWQEWVDLPEEMEKEKMADVWIRNIIGFSKVRDSGEDVQLDLKLGDPDED